MLGTAFDISNEIKNKRYSEEAMIKPHNNHISNHSSSQSYHSEITLKSLWNHLEFTLKSRNLHSHHSDHHKTHSNHQGHDQIYSAITKESHQTKAKQKHTEDQCICIIHQIIGLF